MAFIISPNLMDGGLKGVPLGVSITGAWIFMLTVSRMPSLTSSLNAPNLLSKSAIISSANLTPKKCGYQTPNNQGRVSIV